MMYMCCRVRGMLGVVLVVVKVLYQDISLTIVSSKAPYALRTSVHDVQ
jgi:hypothetical protein